MFVKEFGQKLSSAELNQELGKVYDWNLNLSEMTTNHAHSILGSMREKLRGIKESSKGHFAERNPQYMEALLVSRVLESFIEEKFHSEAEERKRMKALETKKQTYAKGIKKFEESFKQRFGANAAKAMEATAKKMAGRKNVEEAMSVLRVALSGGSMINESEFEQAKAVMAARDMVDTVQDMVEKLSKLMNQDLPALADVMRSEVGQAQSDAFVQAATSAVTPLLDQSRQARQALDNAARSAAGEQGVSAAPMMPAPGGEAGGAAPMPAPEAGAEVPPAGGEEAATADTAAGGAEELGRGKRV